jgi:two-component system CheB/CheR fusion protein
MRRTTELNVVIYGLIVAVIVLGIVVFRKTRLDLARNEQIREELYRGNIRLEERVAQQMSDMKASEEKYKTLFYKSPLPKWIYDLENLRFLEVNDAAVRIYGYTQDEFRDMTIRDIRPIEDYEELLKDVVDVRSTGESRRQFWRHMRKDGTLLEVEVTAHSFDYDGRKARMVVASDVTERRRSEQLLQNLNEALSKRAEELAASNAELERFAYIASHDLQEPLRMVSSFLQLLQKRYQNKLDEKADQYIHYAVDGAERMKALILDLLEYSRVGTGKENFALVDMGEAMEEVANIFREKIAEAGATLQTDILPMVKGDKVQLTQLLQNLVGNALKYHSELPARIRVMVKERPGFWEFSVRDNGIGIDAQYFDKIFIIFQRLHNKSQYSGTGIGLAICKKIVERHGGKIWVEPAPDQGSIFLFTINKQL